MSWLTDYLYRKTVPLSRAAGVATDYQMRLLVAENASTLNTGGTITVDGAYTIHTFLLADTGTNFTACKAGNIEILVVAGGGGGGGGWGGIGGGGGGAGGLQYNASFAVTTQSYSVTVGVGGNGAESGDYAEAQNGGNSVFSTITSYGGGRGAQFAKTGTRNGGSGGGGAWTDGAGGVTPGTATQSPGFGYAGGNGKAGAPSSGGGGGGGAGAVGSAGTISAGGNGGIGLAYSISGVSTFYAAGGGGGSTNVSYGSGGSSIGGNGGYSGTAGSNAIVNRGSGGGGGSQNTGGGGKGSAGIVIIRYLTADFLGGCCCETNCNTDFSDLRFTTYGGTLLDHWVESISGTTPNQIATVWIKFDSIGITDTIFCMYYGNAAATSISSGVDTFVFFDDFDGGSFDLTRWTDRGVGSSHTYTQSSSILTLTSIGTSDYCNADINTSLGTNYAIRSKANIDATSSDVTKQKWLWWNAAGDSPDKFAGFATGNPFSGYLGARFLESGTEAQWNSSNAYTGYHIFDVIRNGTTSVILGIDNNIVLTQTTQVMTGNNKPSIGAYGSSVVAYFDWFLVRQYLAVEPAFGVWGVEEMGITFPEITVQPVDEDKIVGETAIFSLIATGGSLTYQWQKLISGTWTNIGTSIESYETPILVYPDDTGFFYRCIVSNSLGDVTSDEVLLIVNQVCTYSLNGSVLKSGTPILDGLTVNLGAVSTRTLVDSTISSVVDGTFVFDLIEYKTLISSEAVVRTSSAYDLLVNTPVISIKIPGYLPYNSTTGEGDYIVYSDTGVEWVVGGDSPALGETYFVDYYYYSESYFVEAYYPTDEFNAQIFDYIKPVITRS